MRKTIKPIKTQEEFEKIIDKMWEIIDATGSLKSKVLESISMSIDCSIYDVPDLIIEFKTTADPIKKAELYFYAFDYPEIVGLNTTVEVANEFLSEYLTKEEYTDLNNYYSGMFKIPERYKGDSYIGEFIIYAVLEKYGNEHMGWFLPDF